ncbi:MAG: diol dehydratase small subunit [Cellulosilyticaceae bacterium]
MDLYPLIEKRPELIRSKTGKRLDEITMDRVVEGQVGIEDLSISKDTLILQASVALEHGKKQQAENFVRASELIAVPDDKILEIYNLLRPYRATETQLRAISRELKEVYEAPICAAFVEETLAVYKKRDILAKE